MEVGLEEVRVKVVQNEGEFVDSEQEKSDVEVEEEIFVEGGDEPVENDTGDSDDDDEQKEAEEPIEAESGTDSSKESSMGSSEGPKVPKEKKEKVPTDNRNYVANPKEEFIEVDLSIHPQKLAPPVFNSNGTGRKSVCMSKDKKPGEIIDYMLNPLIDLVVKLYNISRSDDIKELTVAKFRAWLGIHFMTYAWKFLVLKGTGTVEPMLG